MKHAPGDGRGAWLRACSWKRHFGIAVLFGPLPALAAACDGEPGTLSLFPNGRAHPAAAGAFTATSGAGGGGIAGSPGGGTSGSTASTASGGLPGGGRAGTASGGASVAGRSAGGGNSAGSAAGSGGAAAGHGGAANGGASGQGGTAGAWGESGAAPEGGTTGTPCVLGDCPCSMPRDCVPPLPACVDGQCVECAKSNDCDDDHPVCTTATNSCGPCSSSSQCRMGLTCNAEGECSDGP